MTQAVLRTDQRAMRVILRFWEVVSALDSALVDLALEQLLSSAMTGSSANLALIGEVRLRLDALGHLPDLTPRLLSVAGHPCLVEGVGARPDALDRSKCTSITRPALIARC